MKANKFFFISASVMSVSALATDSNHFSVGPEAQYTHSTYREVLSANYIAKGEADAFFASASGTATIPLTEGFGFKFGGRVLTGYSDTDISATYQFGTTTLSNSYSTDSDITSLALDALVYFRDPTIGRVAFGYEWAHEDVDVTQRMGGTKQEFDYSSSPYSLLGRIEGYIGSFTLSLQDERTFSDEEGGYREPHTDSIFAGVDYYVTPNVRLGVDVGFDDAKKGYRANIEFQPGFARNYGSFHASYLYDKDESKTNGILIGFEYFFRSRVDLKTRDRQYR